MEIYTLTSPLKCLPAPQGCHRTVVRSRKCWLSEGVWDRNGFIPWTGLWAVSIGSHLHTSVLVWGRTHVPICFSSPDNSFLATCSIKLKRASLQIRGFPGKMGREWKNGVALAHGKVLVLNLSWPLFSLKQAHKLLLETTDFCTDLSFACSFTGPSTFKYRWRVEKCL